MRNFSLPFVFQSSANFLVDKRTSMFLAVFVRILCFCATVFRRNFRSRAYDLPRLICTSGANLLCFSPRSGSAAPHSRTLVKRYRRSVVVVRDRLGSATMQAELYPCLRLQAMQSERLARGRARELRRIA